MSPSLSSPLVSPLSPASPICPTSPAAPPPLLQSSQEHPWGVLQMLHLRMGANRSGREKRDLGGTKSSPPGAQQQCDLTFQPALAWGCPQSHRCRQRGGSQLSEGTLCWEREGNHKLSLVTMGPAALRPQISILALSLCHPSEQVVTRPGRTEAERCHPVLLIATPRVTRQSWGPPHLEQICTVGTAASPKNPHTGNTNPGGARASSGRGCRAPGTCPHPVVTPLPPQFCGLWESFDVLFALRPPPADPGARAGKGTGAPSQVSPWLWPSPDAPAWRAAQGFALAPAPRSGPAERSPCLGTSVLRASWPAGSQGSAAPGVAVGKQK